MLQLFRDFVRHRVSLPRVRNRADNKKVGERGDFAQIENGKVNGFFGFSRTRRSEPIGQFLRSSDCLGVCGTTCQARRNALLRLAYYTGGGCVNGQNCGPERCFFV